MAVTTLPSSPSGEITHGGVREKINEIIIEVNAPTPHFGAYSIGPLTLSKDSSNPSYLTDINIFDTSTDEFQVITGNDGEFWVKNISTKTFSMEGDSMWQLAQGAGGAAEFVLWSERTTDDGTTFTENAQSLRRIGVSNNSNDSQGIPSAVGTWAPGEAIRWAMFNNGSGDITLESPSITVNGSNTVTGLGVYWQLTAV